VAPDCGVVTGAGVSGCEGMNTGGSSRTVYSRTRRPRAQAASTSSVTYGSVTERFDVTRMVARPSCERLTEKSKLLRYAGRSIP
jgi:NAD-dependent SIR2 family protein deacetylase